MTTLTDKNKASAYLTKSLQTKDLSKFLIALKHVAEENHGDISKAGKVANVSKSTIYEMFDYNGNPLLRNVELVLNSLGLYFGIIGSENDDTISKPLKNRDMVKFLEGLIIVAKTHHGGMSDLSRNVKIARQALYKMSSYESNPLFKNVNTILNSTGLSFCVHARD